VDRRFSKVVVETRGLLFAFSVGMCNYVNRAGFIDKEAYGSLLKACVDASYMVCPLGLQEQLHASSLDETRDPA
jgi:hypothetical protein